MQATDLNVCRCQSSWLQVLTKLQMGMSSCGNHRAFMPWWDVIHHGTPSLLGTCKHVAPGGIISRFMMFSRCGIILSQMWDLQEFYVCMELEAILHDFCFQLGVLSNIHVCKSTSPWIPRKFTQSITNLRTAEVPMKIQLMISTQISVQIASDRS